LLTLLTNWAQALFDDSKSFYDVNVVHETRNQTYSRLAKVGAKVGLDEKELLKLLWIDDKPASDGSLNTGNAVTNDLKVLVKVNRLVGVHVTPTVIFDGVVENSISSSFSGQQWEEWLEKNVA
jgi:protein-disulfide isomerase